MLKKRLAAVGAVVGLTVGLGSTPASAEPVITSFANYAGAMACLDFRADYGPYVFGCNHTDYQMWYWAEGDEYTALRQKATKLCLTVRNDQPTMKPCAAADQAAVWQISSSNPRLIQNSATHKCLARMANDRLNTTTCTGGESQRWWRN
ncbi:RICIN domain-containing protein (plasmid) [Streptomyces sp. NBC_00841]|uniref:RICIN domain-containing protein n=1 Tax=unclassified Streptomyces TaxID=2593676 RepID=UPI002253FCC1|nr:MULTISPECIES: ricin-type beta-trefoil lectin domain protein [unclassified Streptomyces]MCX4538145.1 RICIN domain-containing protein [Streptomyces sp. NBC_01669]WSA05309.1 RICIN domain-containing protein [Streptomyces sp. NBC_00841]